MRCLLAISLVTGMTMMACSAPGKTNARGETTREKMMESSPSSSAVPLEGTHWTAIEISGAPVNRNEQRETFMELQGAEHRVVGSGGCNRMSGTYTLQGDTLRFGPLISTKMACPDVMDQEQRFFNALDTVTRYAVSGDTLQLFADMTLVARFEAQQPK